ncbi:hypothetical protein [Tsukamurella pseudospumae]|uniref:Uncharacterized protein n=1 Tax=Tsukamurella pseudospumae TaxID=239498 RepID=A0A138ATX1_9ACTN|nr:hypothetical protein [Tsukamurella pseudospumae]KXP13890.1 hypothetical protein AXK60_22565 [Tsukamurella pseudospumae]
MTHIKVEIDGLTLGTVATVQQADAVRRTLAAAMGNLSSQVLVRLVNVAARGGYSLVDLTTPTVEIVEYMRRDLDRARMGMANDSRPTSMGVKGYVLWAEDQIEKQGQ